MVSECFPVLLCSFLLLLDREVSFDGVLHLGSVSRWLAADLLHDGVVKAAAPLILSVTVSLVDVQSLGMLPTLQFVFFAL